VRPLHG